MLQTTADTPSEDILCVLYDVFEYIDNALKQGGRVLVHCSQASNNEGTAQGVQL
jgi:hypothetical protein